MFPVSQHAVAVQPWEGVLDCRQDGPLCAQGAYSQLVGQEDCLHLSVYTPKVLYKQVIVYSDIDSIIPCPLL